MRLAACALLLAFTASASTDARAILNHVQKTYRTLRSFHIVAIRQARAAGLRSSAVEIDLAEKIGGIYRLTRKQGHEVSILASNGAKTWKASPKTKEWTQIDATAVPAGEADPDRTASSKMDLYETAKYLTISRFVFMANSGEQPEFVKEGLYKIGGDRVECDVVRVSANQVVHEIWVDRARGLILQDEEKRIRHLGSFEAVVDTVLKVKDIEINSDFGEAAFEFKPEPSWREVEALTLPGEEPGGNLLGTKAADFTIKALDGRNVQLSALRGKVVVLNFWATWCPPCREELPELDRLRAEFGERASFLAVTDEDGLTARVFLNKNHNELRVLLDPRKTVHRQFGVTAIPTLLVIDRDGMIRQHFVGSRTQDKLRKAIENVLSPSPGA